MIRTTDDEIIEVARIESKQANGEQLSRGEENILAYSPYGTKGGCHVVGVVEPTTLFANQPSRN